MTDSPTSHEALADAVNTVLGHFNLPASLEGVWLKTVTFDTVAPGEVLDVLARIGASVSEGWLRCQGQLAVIRKAAELPANEAVLEGELALDDGSSLLLRPDGRGRVRIIRQQEADAQEAGARAVVATDVEHRATPHAAKRQVRMLRYRVYYEDDAERGALPCGYRFCGFGFSAEARE